MIMELFAKKTKRFRYFVGLFLFSVIALILIGSMVRSTGAGLGCPDWPRCFGLWVPPTSVYQLPADYLLHYDGIPFNALKTWTEYLNRLSGVVVGILSTILLIWGLRFWRLKPQWTWLAFFSWLLVGVNGGIGAWVVSSRLVPMVISLHMVLAMLLVVVVSRLYWVLGAGHSETVSPARARYYWLFVALFLIQMVLGIELRQLMDLANQAGLARIEWLPSAGVMFWIHRSFSWAVLLSAGLLLWTADATRKRLARGVWIMVILQMLTGVGLAYSGMLFAMQPLHLVLSAGVIVCLVGIKTDRQS
jgi:heme a synthase